MQTLSQFVDSCQTIGAGLLGIVRTAELTERQKRGANTKRTVEYMRLCNRGLLGSLLISPVGVLSNRQAEIHPLIKEIQSKITRLYGKKDGISIGPRCGWNSVNIVKSLRNSYDVSIIHVDPIKKRAPFTNYRGEYHPTPGNYRIDERDAIWGVGSTMGVTYHALAFFKFPDQRLYISVESTLACMTFQLQFHITESVESMMDFLEFRYMAESTPVETMTLGQHLRNRFTQIQQQEGTQGNLSHWLEFNTTLQRSSAAGAGAGAGASETPTSTTTPTPTTTTKSGRGRRGSLSASTATPAPTTKEGGRRSLKRQQNRRSKTVKKLK